MLIYYDIILDSVPCALYLSKYQFLYSDFVLHVYNFIICMPLKPLSELKWQAQHAS
jgi:hypothetical protein